MCTYTNIHWHTETSLTGNDDFNNERIHFFIKILISHSLFSKGWCLLCVRDELETGTDLFWPKFFFAYSSTSSSSWMGLLNRGSLRAQSPQSASWFSSLGILSLTHSNHLTPTCFHLFTQVHLLIDGSVEGQYITLWPRQGDW